MIDNFKFELEKIKNEINKLENKYTFIQDYNLITSLLNKLEINEIELDIKEINNNFVYIVEKDLEKSKIIIKKGD